VLELAVLGLLKERDLHGYELKRRLGEVLGPWSGVSFGSLYPALRRLERDGAVEAQPDRPSASRIPMTGSLSGERAAFRSPFGAAKKGRAKKVYRITEAGQAEFARLLSAGPDTGAGDGRGFSLRLAFARHLSPEARVRMLERRRSDLAQRLERARHKACEAGLDSYELSLAEHSAETIERDISWLDHLIEAEDEPAGVRTPTATGAHARRPHPEEDL
jgi:DNA-binding PadR family transcriptional regulator